MNNQRPERITTCYTIRKDHKSQIDALRYKYNDKYFRLRSDIIDTGIGIILTLVQKNGPDWFYQNKEELLKIIPATFAE